MTTDEKQALVDLQGTPGFKVLEYLVKIKIDELKDVSQIDTNSQTDLGVQALAQQKAVKLLKDFLNDLGFHKALKEKNNTYE